MNQNNCFLVGGPMDGRTYVLRHVLQELKFEKPKPVRVGDIAIPYERDLYSLVAWDERQGTAVYVHDPMTFYPNEALLHAAQRRHQDRGLLQSALGALRESNKLRNFDLIKAIEEALK